MKKSIENKNIHIKNNADHIKNRNERYKVEDLTREYTVGVGFRASNDLYRENYDEIFNKDKKEKEYFPIKIVDKNGNESTAWIKNESND